MLIDWFTVAAQIVNFLILVALLKYFLYDRIVKAMDEREERIKSRLDEAQKKKEEAAQEAKSYREKNKELETKRQEMLSRAKEEAETRRKELVQQARQEAEDLRAGWRKAVEKERESFIRDLRKMAAYQVYAVARLSLKDLADADLEERAVDVFLERILKMGEQERKELADSVKNGDGRVVVRSAFEMPATSRQKITRALHDHIADDIEVEYETASELIMGIEMKTPDRKLSWTVKHYLATLEDAARESLDKETQAGRTEDQDNESEEE